MNRLMPNTRPAGLVYAKYLLLSLVLLSSSQGQDLGQPDSAYFGTPSYYSSNCDSSVSVVIPAYLLADKYADFIAFSASWMGDVECDTAILYLIGEADSVQYDVDIDRSAQTVGGAIVVLEGWVSPTNGKELFLELYFNSSLGDSLILDFLEGFNPRLENLFEAWVPTFSLPDTTLYFPTTFIGSPGDADCDGSVTITDAVFIVNYIFAAGPTPKAPDSADPNNDCFISITDAVFLVNYIFAGGSAPEAGCIQ